MSNSNFLNTKPVTSLLRAIASLENLDEAKKFLRDLLTEGELLEFANRWQVAQMLQARVPYIQIEKQTGMSSTTIARINKWLKTGMGGYRLMLYRLSIPPLTKGRTGGVTFEKPQNSSASPSVPSRFSFGTNPSETHHHHSSTYDVENGP